MKRFELKIGFIVSLFISLLISFARAIRIEVDDYTDLLSTTLYNFLVAFTCWVIASQLLHYKKNYKTPWLAAASTILGMLFSVGSYYLIELTSYSLTLLNQIPVLHKVVMLCIRGGLLGYFEFLIVYYMFTQKESQRINLENEKLKKENLETRLGLLKQQMTPHFLFNALNTITTITQEEETKEYTIRLANVYRHLLQYNESHLVTIQEELDFLHSYIYIQKTRFEDALHVDIDIPRHLMQYRIPTLSLQVLVENAIKHNVATVSHPLIISLSEEERHIVARNNLQPKRSSEPSTYYGLKSVHERYRLLSERPVIIENDNGFFSVKIYLLDA